MKDTLKAEFRKLYTVRSTYLITFLVVAFVGFIGFYAEGWRFKPAELAVSGQLTNAIFGGLNLSIFGAIIAILMMTHEYRYNTIMYTLTGSNSRSKVLFSKLIAVLSYALVLTALIAILSPIVTDLGVRAHGHHLVPQTLNYFNIVWRCLFYGLGYGALGLVLATIIRSQIGAIVSLFVIPSVIEPLLSQLLGKSDVYLPFTSLGEVIGNTTIHDHSIPANRAALTFGIYLIIGWLVAWILFLRRDAN